MTPIEALEHVKAGGAILTVILSSSAALAGPPVTINEIRIDQPDADTDEYVELTGPPGFPLNLMTYVVIGDGTGGSGVVEAAIPLSGHIIPPTGFFVIAEPGFSLGPANLTTTLNFENGDNVTHLLVLDFFGGVGQDLDTNNDCILDVTPWLSIVDKVGVILQDPPVTTECHYGPPTVGPDGTFAPGHVFRCVPSGNWTIGVFDEAAANANDTPGALNDACGPQYFFGLPHVALGQAQLVEGGKHIDLVHVLIPSGASGNNGVKVLAIGDLNGFYFENALVEFPPGAQITTRAIGVDATQASFTAGILLHHQTVNGITITPDFSGIGAGTCSAHILSDGELVQVATGISGVAATVPSSATNWKERHDVGCACVAIRWPTPQPMTIPGGGTVVSDLLVLTAENSGSQAVGLQSIEITAQGITEMLISGEWLVMFDDQIPILALGDVHLEPSPDALTLLPVADTAAGIRFFDEPVLLADLDPVELHAQLEPVALGEPGDSFAVSAVGLANDTQVPLLTTRFVNSGNFVEVHVEALPITVEMIVRAYDDGVFVGAVTVPVGLVGALQGPATPTADGFFVSYPGGLATVTVGATFVEDFIFQPGGLVGNELRFTPVNGPAVDALHSVDLTTTVDQITIIGADAVALANAIEVIRVVYDLAPGEMIDFVIVSSDGTVEMQSVGDPDGDDVIGIEVPFLTSDVKYFHFPDCLFGAWFNNYVAGPFPSSSSNVPLLRNPATGLSLAPFMSVSDLSQVPPLNVGQVITVVNGNSPAYPVATIRAPRVPWDQIPLEAWGNPDAFPLHSGQAQVAEVVNMTVFIVCGPDINCDGVVNVGDLLELINAWGDCPALPAPCPADINDDGEVNVIDLLQVVNNWT